MVLPMNSHRASFNIVPLVCRLMLNRIWESFIPFPYLQVFHRGAYYAKEVIPEEVAVIALNTMYFYDSNKGIVQI